MDPSAGAGACTGLTMVNVEMIAGNVRPVSEGIWAMAGTPDLSFPEDAYDRNVQIEEDSFWFGHRNECLLAAIRMFPPRGTLFDVGGGNGFVTLALRRSGFDAILVEPAMAGALNARARGLAPIICATLEGAGFRPASLPAIGAFDVIEHLADDVGFLKTALTLLSAEGMLFLTVPAYNWLWSRNDARAGHYRRYTLSSLRAKLLSVGFEVKYSTYIFAALPAAIFLGRSLRGRLGPPSRVAANAPAQHRSRSGLVGRALDALWAAEIRRIRRGWPIRFGGSCLVVAQKPQATYRKGAAAATTAAAAACDA